MYPALFIVELVYVSPVTLVSIPNPQFRFQYSFTILLVISPRPDALSFAIRFQAPILVTIRPDVIINPLISLLPAPPPLVQAGILAEDPQHRPLLLAPRNPNR